jgi:hypothetical protein
MAKKKAHGFRAGKGPDAWKKNKILVYPGLTDSMIRFGQDFFGVKKLPP